jgi:hypothetical protein
MLGPFSQVKMMKDEECKVQCNRYVNLTAEQSVFMNNAIKEKYWVNW